MGTDERDDERARLERQLVVLRWLVAAFGAVQVGFASATGPATRPSCCPSASPSSSGSTVGNVAIAGAARKATGPRSGPLGIRRLRPGRAGRSSVSSGSRRTVPPTPSGCSATCCPLEGAARWGSRARWSGPRPSSPGRCVHEFGAAAASSAMPSAPVLAFRGRDGGRGRGGRRVVRVLRRAARPRRPRDRAREAEAAAGRAEAAAAKGGPGPQRGGGLPRGRPRRTRQDRCADPAAHGGGDRRELGCTALGLLVRDRVRRRGGVRRSGSRRPRVPATGTSSPASSPVAAAAVEGPADRRRARRWSRRCASAARSSARSTSARRPDGGPDDDARGAAPGPDSPTSWGLVLESARLRADQEATVNRLRELDQMKSDFVAITSHELRTPLAGIRGFVDMLRRRGAELSSGGDARVPRASC